MSSIRNLLIGHPQKTQKYIFWGQRENLINFTFQKLATLQVSKRYHDKPASYKHTHNGKQSGSEAECGGSGDGSMYVAVFIGREERVLTLDATPLHILVPALSVVGGYQWGLAPPGRVESHRAHLVLGAAITGEWVISNIQLNTSGS